jgi:hypothetical protein
MPLAHTLALRAQPPNMHLRLLYSCCAACRRPKQVHIPLMLTVYAMLGVKQFRLLGPDDASMKQGFFDVPDGFKVVRPPCWPAARGQSAAHHCLAAELWAGL